MSDFVEQTIQLVYLGTRQLLDGKRCWLWYEIKPEENRGTTLSKTVGTNREWTFSKQNICKDILPGTIVSIQKIGETRVSLKTVKIQGCWENEADRLQWQAETTATEDSFTWKRKKLKEIKDSLPVANLRPFQQAYFRLPAREKACLLNFILEQIISYGN